jgi:hypothetical protein|tara:strand:+ start:64 stop:1026 length:963 start_codon:yes stop_codon:yes gene_type:complete
MTINEAILKVLEEEKSIFYYKDVYNKIKEKEYYVWESAKTPADTIAANLGGFIRQNDKRVKRIKTKRGFYYYFSKYENELNLTEIVEKEIEPKKIQNLKVYQERDLHLLLSSYLNNENILSKTIFHEQSSFVKDNHQKWIHPDIIGISFLKLKNESSQALMKLINKSDSFNISSYEIKREIKSDYELKKCFFQAVSNSSWANYGYLVAFDIGDNLKEEMERLSQSFGIGVIELNANPFKSEILYPAKYKDLDFITIDKLCEINLEFKKFISLSEALLTATKKYAEGAEKSFIDFCDSFLSTDTEVKNYCLDKNIPLEKEV